MELAEVIRLELYLKAPDAPPAVLDKIALMAVVADEEIESGKWLAWSDDDRLAFCGMTENLIQGLRQCGVHWEGVTRAENIAAKALWLRDYLFAAMPPAGRA